MNALLALFGAAVALAGGDKLAGDRGYNRMFRHLGWSQTAVKGVALAETIGGILMIPPATRRLGGAVVTVASAAVIASELQHRDASLAAPRALVLLGGLFALLVPRPR